ncbi:MAG: hypothetical protein P8104_09730, partial [Gammaproteobacteria bacterium]
SRVSAIVVLGCSIRPELFLACCYNTNCYNANCYGANCYGANSYGTNSYGTNSYDAMCCGASKSLVVPGGFVGVSDVRVGFGSRGSASNFFEEQSG